jgi:hypothetical protein
LSTGQIPEPALKIAGKRLFTAEDVQRFAHHFKVAPNWDILEPGEPEPEAPGLRLRPPYEVVANGTGHEIRDGGGEVFASASDRGRALILCGLLEMAARG